MQKESGARMTVINVVVDDELKELVRQRANQEKRTMSQWVRLLIEQELEAQQQERLANK